MKKYMPILFAFVFVFIFNVNTANAAVPGCTATSNFSTTTGERCTPDSAVPVIGCESGYYLFSPVTGQSCTGVSSGGGGGSSSSDDYSAVVAKFNSLISSNLKSSTNVRALQQLLKDEGYYYGRVDGKYGKITARAVKDFQEDNDITTIIQSTPIVVTPDLRVPVVINNSSVTVVSPNGGENLIKADTYTIRWNDTNDISTHEIRLIPYGSSTSTSYTIANTQGSTYNWSVGVTWENTSVPDGTYTIKVCQTGTNVCDSSDSYFRIAAAVDHSITLVSPNGGEVWTKGTTQLIQWGTKNFKSTDTVQIEVWDSRRNCSVSDPGCLRGFDVIAQVQNTGGYLWNTTLSSLSGYYGDTAQAVYKIRVIASAYPLTEVTKTAEDWSDSYFSIIAPPTVSQYHSADTNKDWKIDSSELSSFQTLYEYRSGTVRTGEYSVVLSVADTASGDYKYTYVPGPGIQNRPTHSGDSNKDWKISLFELTRVIEFKNSAGYKVQAGTEDGFAPIAAVVSATQLKANISSTSPKGSTFVRGSKDQTIAKYDLSANGGSVEIKTMRLVCQGCASQQFYSKDIDNLKLFDGSTQIGASAVYSDPFFDFTFSSGAFNIGAGSTKTITLKADIVSASNSFPTQINHYIELRSITAMTGGTLSITGLPLYGDSNFISPATVQPLSCSTLQQTQQGSFNVCKDGGFEKACFNKDGVFQGCSLSSVDTCTSNNMNASTNISCSVGLTQPVIIASASTGGTISPSGNISVSNGSNKTFNLTPNNGYKVEHITIDNSYDLPAALSYTFYNITQSHIIGAIFSPIPTSSLTITTSSPLPNAKVGQAYRTEVVVSGGIMGGGSSASLISGSLPPGISSSTCSTNICAGYAGTPTTPGTYYFTVKITQGSQVVSKDFSLTVDPVTVAQPSITVLSPNGGESLQTDSNYIIRWSSVGISSSDYIHVMINNEYGDSYLAWWLPGNATEYSWKVGTGIGGAGFSPPLLGSNFKIKIKTSSETYMDMSDSVFTITGPSALGRILGGGSLSASAIGATTNTSANENVNGTSSFHFTGYLEQGSYGNEVMELQKLLRRGGYYTGNIDGVFGSKLKEALMKFQTENGLKADGILGYQVRTFLNK